MFAGYQVHARHQRPGHERHAGGGEQAPQQRIQPQLCSTRALHVRDYQSCTSTVPYIETVKYRYLKIHLLYLRGIFIFLVSILSTGRGEIYIFTLFLC